GHARRDALAALPQRGGVEGAAIAAGVQVGAALDAGLLGCGLVEPEPLRAAGVALEDLGAEAAGGPSAGRSFDSLILRFVRGARRTGAAGRRRIGRITAAAILIAAVP